MLDKNLPQKGDVVAGKYQIDRLLGSGGMGAVYQVTHRVTGKAFAIKWLLPRLSAETDAVQRFIREAQVAGRVDHPNIVEVYDVGQEGDTFYMVMELLHGESLAQRLTTKGRLSPAEICQILIPVARGLEAAHRAGVIHRDLKPDNIFLCHSEDGSDLPKLLDFGISKVSEATGEITSGITRQGAIMGTPYYMAPEQMRGHGVDARTDVYALGVILYQALSGELPFTGETFADLLLKIVSTDPKPLAALAPDVPKALIQVVERALCRDQAARIATAGALGQLLQPYVATAAVASMSPGAGASYAAPGMNTQTPLATSFKPAGRASASLERRSLARRVLPAAALTCAGLGAAAWFVLQPGAAGPQAVAVQPGHELPLVRPLPVQGVEPSAPSAPVEPAAELAPAEPNVALDEVLPTPKIVQIEPADAGVVAPKAVPVAQLPAAPSVPADGPVAAELPKIVKLRVPGLAKPSGKKPSEDLFAPKQPKDESRRAARSGDMSYEEFISPPSPPPSRRAKP